MRKFNDWMNENEMSKVLPKKVELPSGRTRDATVGEGRPLDPSIKNDFAVKKYAERLAQQYNLDFNIAKEVFWSGFNVGYGWAEYGYIE